MKVDSDEDDYDDVDNILTSAELAKQSRLKRWKGEEINGLSGEDNTSKWSKVCFDDVPPLSDEIDSSWNVAERAAGAVQFLSGAAEAALGFVGGVATAETGIGPVLGAFLFERGVDNFGTGLDRLLSGSSRDTQLNHILTDSGLSESDASLLEDSVDLFGTGGAGIVGGLARYSGFFAKKTDSVVMKLAARSHINGLRLEQELAYEEAKSMFKKNGELTNYAIESSRMIRLKINNPELKSRLSERGSLADWGKYETTPIHTNNGLARIHFYYNPATGNVYYGMDYKAIFNHQGHWGLEPSRNFTTRPGF